MKCPDCSNRLSDMMIKGNIVHRCFRCGGFWTDSRTANFLTSRDLIHLRRLSVDPVWLKGGKGVCPLDGTMLTRYRGESVPQNLAVMHCIRCGKWWFPRDGFIDYKPAVEAKLNYFRLWGKDTDLGEIILPMVMVIILTAGAVAGVMLVREKQTAQILAGSGVTEFSASYLDGEAEINFVSGRKVHVILYQKPDEKTWRYVPAAETEGKYSARISGIEEGQVYAVKINGQDYWFTAQ